MTKEVVYCDRCGKRVKYPISTRYMLFGKTKIFSLFDKHKTEDDGRLDLCQACCDSLVEWVKEGKKGK